MKKDNLVLDLLQIDTDDHELEPLEREPIPGARSRTRAFIKVQDGCDNRCTFCVTTLARGTGRSLTIKQILSDIQSALAGEDGAREVVLSGVHLGSWGYDFSKPQHLSQLVKAILMDTDVPRLRLSSLEPWDLDENFFTLWENPRLCRHLHLPLQSGCESTLRRMARKTTPAAFKALIDAARTAVPDVAITTDLIAGFPGEDEIEFQESIEFTRSMQFAGGHVFTYSARPGTAASRMVGQVHHQKRKDRNARLRAVLDESAAAYRDRFLGRELPVLWESVTTLEPEIWHMNGLTDNYLRVHAKAPRHLWNRITNVRLTSASASGLQGILVP
jgi:threonylcarbamoyladenosine tRNA methylthiotransferase MtaB